MDFISAYQAIDNSTLELLKKTNSITSPLLKEERIPLRLTDSPFILTEDIRLTCRSVITSHDVQQYRKQFHSIKLEDNVDSWLLDLLKIDEGEEF